MRLPHIFILDVHHVVTQETGDRLSSEWVPVPATVRKAARDRVVWNVVLFRYFFEWFHHFWYLKMLLLCFFFFRTFFLWLYMIVVSKRASRRRHNSILILFQYHILCEIALIKLLQHRVASFHQNLIHFIFWRVFRRWHHFRHQLLNLDIVKCRRSRTFLRCYRIKSHFWWVKNSVIFFKQNYIFSVITEVLVGDA